MGLQKKIPLFFNCTISETFIVCYVPNYKFIPTFYQILISFRKSSNPERCREPIHETWRWLEREIRKLFRFQSPVTNLAPNLRHSFRPRFQPNSYKGTFLQNLSRMFMNSQIKKSTQNTTLPGGKRIHTDWYLVSDWKVQFCLQESISFILDRLSEKLISEICVLVWFGSLGSNTICGRSKMQIILHHRLPLNLPPLLRQFHFRCLYNSSL